MRVNEVDYHYFVRFGLSLCTLSRIRALSVCSTIRAKIRHACVTGHRAVCYSRLQPTPIALCCLDSKGSYRNRSPARSCVCALLSSTLTSMPHPSRLLFIVVAAVHRGDAGAACLQIYRPLRISLQSISSDEGASSTSPVHSRTGTQGDKTLTGDFAGEGLAGDTASCCATISGESDEP